MEQNVPVDKHKQRLEALFTDQRYGRQYTLRYVSTLACKRVHLYKNLLLNLDQYFKPKSVNLSVSGSTTTNVRQ